MGIKKGWNLDFVQGENFKQQEDKKQIQYLSFSGKDNVHNIVLLEPPLVCKVAYAPKANGGKGLYLPVRESYSIYHELNKKHLAEYAEKIEEKFGGKDKEMDEFDQQAKKAMWKKAFNSKPVQDASTRFFCHVYDMDTDEIVVINGTEKLYEAITTEIMEGADPSNTVFRITLESKKYHVEVIDELKENAVEKIQKRFEKEKWDLQKDVQVLRWFDEKEITDEELQRIALGETISDVMKGRKKVKEFKKQNQPKKPWEEENKSNKLDEVKQVVEEPKQPEEEEEEPVTWTDKELDLELGLIKE